ncbi:protein kinase, partial [Myxococcota bacterium]|nr:protein kinase [Myxococcota bacterium]
PPPPPPDVLVDLGVSREEPGRYHIRGEKYRGSIGRILIGTDTHIGREVAIKELIIPGSPADDGVVINGRKPLKDSANIRFLREARLAGQLQHPSVIPIYEIGKRIDGSLYYTMRHVNGKNLGDSIFQAKSLAARLKLLPHFLDLCNAIAYAHSQGIIHRDIKPDNIMIGEFGETVVLDWGLAKMRTGDDPGGRRIAAEIQKLTQGDANTIAGQALGTPAYMPPEQARGEVNKIDEQSDVYSLGVVLFELLVGSPPWSGNVYDVLHKVVHEPVPDISMLQPAAPRSLVRLATAALQKNKAARLRSVNDLIDGLEEYLSGEKSGGQKPIDMFASLFANRKKAVLAGLSGVVLLFVILGVLFFSWQGQKDRAQSLQSRVVSSEGQRLLSHFLMAQAFNEISIRMENDSQFAAAQIYASSSLIHNPTHEKSPWFQKGFGIKHHQAQQVNTEAFSRLYRTNFALSLSLESIARFNSSLVKLAVSPQKNIAAVGCYDNTIRILDLNGKNKPLILEGHRDRIHGLDFSPDGNFVVSAGYDKSVIVWDISQGKAKNVLEGHKERVIDVAWSPDGKTIASLDYSGVIFLWDVDEKKRSGVINGKKYYKIFRIQFTSDGKNLVAGAMEDNVLLFEVGHKRRLIRRIKGFFQRINAIAVSPDGRRVVACGDSNTIVMWDLLTGKMLHSLQGHTATVLDVKISSDGRRLYSGGLDNAIRIWDMETGAGLYTISAHKERVYGVAQLADNVRIATASWDNTVKIWKMQRSAILPVLKGHSDYIVKAAFSPDGRYIASSSWDRSVRIWDGKLGTNLVHFKGFADKVWAVAWSPDGKKLASSCWDGSITLLDAENGQVIKRLVAHKDRVFGIAWSPDGGKLISSSKDNTVIIWDVEWGRPLHTLKGHSDSVRNVAVSPRGGLIASVSKDMTVIIWNLSGKKIRTINAHKGLVSGVDFSSDGSLLATSSKDKMVMLFESATGKKIREFKGHEAWVNTVRFSRDDNYLTTASDDHTVRVWKASTGKMLLVLHATRESISAEFSPDGKTLLYGDGNYVRMVPLDFSVADKNPRELLEAIQRRSGLKLEGFLIEVQEPDALLK